MLLSNVMMLFGNDATKSFEIQDSKYVDSVRIKGQDQNTKPWLYVRRYSLNQWLIY